LRDYYDQICTVFLLFSTLPASAEEITVSRFATEGLKGWESKSFKGVTNYNIVHEDGKTVLKAHAKGTASGLSKNFIQTCYPSLSKVELEDSQHY
jgi:hypothetical protein